MACDNTIQVLNGSILTFESEVQICSEIATLTNLQFTDTLQKGLKVVPQEGETDVADVTVTINGIDSDPPITGTIDTDPDTNIDTLTVTIPKAELETAYPVTVTVKFQATVDDLDALLENADPTNAGKLTNTGTFTALAAGDAPIGKAATVTLADTNVEEYSPEVSGYSMTVCPSNTDVLKAKFCLNTICGDFTNGQYVLTITAPCGISFYQDTIAAEPPVKIEAYTGCCCKSTQIKIDDESVVFSDDNKTVTITIEDENVDTALQSDTSDLCNHNISVYIPYKFDNAASACTKDSLIIKGSMKVNTGADTTTLAELKNFGLYVNVDCGNLVGISKTILC